MDAVDTTLRGVRRWFLVWFAAQAVIGTALALKVIEGLSLYPVVGFALRSVTPEFTVAMALLGLAIELGLAWLVLTALLDRRPWARIVMLVIAWITVLGAVGDLIMLPGATALFGPAIGESGGWGTFAALTLATKSIDLAFWGWTIAVLQLTPAVRTAFACEPPGPRDGRPPSPGSA